MAKRTNPIETPTEPVVDTRVDVVQKSGPGRAWWILSSAAGLGLLVIGLLGGILIGQNLRPGMSASQDQAAQILSPSDRPPGLDQLSDRMKVPMHDRQQDRRQEQEPALPPPDVDG
jgi:hypothetical protein